MASGNVDENELQWCVKCFRRVLRGSDKMNKISCCTRYSICSYVMIRGLEHLCMFESVHFQNDTFQKCRFSE